MIWMLGWCGRAVELNQKKLWTVKAVSVLEL